MHSRRSPNAPRGFTLVELLVVVAISGILAAVCVHVFTKRIHAAHNDEAASIVQAIRAAQESYRAENQAYLDVSSTGGASGTGGAGGSSGSGASGPSAADWYPNKTPNSMRYEWHACEAGVTPRNNDCTRWMQLAPAINTPVRFGYLVNAGQPGAMTTPRTSTNPNLPAATTPWYVIQARGEVDSPTGTSAACGASGVVCLVATSLNGELYSEGG